jgi:hypothetical protein
LCVEVHRFQNGRNNAVAIACATRVSVRCNFSERVSA